MLQITLNSHNKTFELDAIAMRPNLPALTSLRFFAALWVVLFHESPFCPFKGLIGTPASRNEATPLSILIANGSLGVSFFFVLSGAILTYSYCQADQTLRGTPRDFWVSRVARLWPMYLVGLFLDAPFFWHLIRSFHPSIVNFGIHLIGNAIPIIFMLQSWIQGQSPIDWNAPGWSLSTEMFFYALFPVLLAKCSKLATSRLLIVLLMAWGASLPSSYHLTTVFPMLNGSAPIITFPKELDFFIGRFPILRLPEFVIGVCIGLLALRHGSVWSKHVAWGGLPAVAFCSLIVLVSCTSPPITTLLLAPLISTLILSFMLSSERSLINRILCNRLLVIGGESSFSMYIIHWPIAKWFIAAETLLGISDGNHIPTHFFSYLALVVITAYLFCRFVERPAYHRLRRRFIGQKTDQKLIDQSTINPEAQSLSQLS